MGKWGNIWETWGKSFEIAGKHGGNPLKLLGNMGEIL
jgi:hypothetical protein